MSGAGDDDHEDAVRAGGPAGELKLQGPTVRRDEIADVAAQLFAERGYHQTSMIAIASGVGIQKPTLYHHFSSKADVLMYIHGSFLDPLLQKHESLAQDDLSAREVLRTVARDIFTVVQSRRGYVRVFNENLRELPEQYSSHIRTQRDRYQRVVEGIIQGGIDSGEFRPVTSVSVVTLGILGMINGAHQWFREAGTMTEQQIADEFVDLLVDGLSAKPRT